MAAYAALVSLWHIIEQIQHHPRPPISLHNEQIESLTEKITFLQDFLEGYSINGGSEDPDALEGRIADAAYAAEDIIESHIVDQIQAGSTSTRLQNVIEDMDFIKGEAIEIKENLAGFQDQLLHRNSMSAGSSRSPPTGQNTMVGFDDVLIKIMELEWYQCLQKVIEDMDLIERDMMEIKEEGIQVQLHTNFMPAGSLKSPSTESPPTGQNMTMVGFDDVKVEIMDKLTGQQSNRQIIAIVGMGGIGKTTLARNIYVNPLIVQHFDILAWVTISQEYNVRDILLQILLCLRTKRSNESLSEDELGEILYKSLSGRRYLIIMDDIWSIEAWNKVKFFFPDNNIGSRIMITSRLLNLAVQLTDCYVLKMDFLDDDKSWNLLCKNVFGEECCPLELEGIGKKIAKNCKGLPLSIIVIGGVLAKSKRTREYWKYVAENLNSIVSLEDNEHCLKILHMSYNQLPIHLKPCFLYMGVFPEDSKIRVSNLIKLWVAEGFLKPISGKSLEVVARDYLEELIDRNLILVHKFGSAGNIKLCIIHDLLRDLCVREAEKEKFFCVLETHSRNIPQGMHTQRRIGIHQSTPKEEYFAQVLRALQSTSLARSLICDSPKVLPPSHNFRLLRVLEAVGRGLDYGDLDSLKAILQLVNSRYLAIEVDLIDIPSHYLSSIHLLWNLQTLIVKRGSCTAPSEIWKMPQLRHVKFDKLDLLDPPMDGRDDFVLGNLQTLVQVRNFKCGEEVVKRIPNIKKLGLVYEGLEEWSSCCLHNLGRLQKLESLGCFFTSKMKPSRSYLVENLNFPRSLKKLSLRGSCLNWEDMKTKIGALPNLQVLKLKRWSFIGPEWETVEGRFCSLKFLLIQDCYDLEYWTTDSTHFPRLERLVLRRLEKLNEIPWEIGEIPTLRSIELEYCSDPAVVSARKIVDEQEELGNVGLQVRVVVQPWEKLGGS
ncbi:hypothetical protein DH2020_041519 [Rehmannia glutinosa]|uniref:Disease resistance protein n=1 Tax=Rehmannia glutinosa TaxID=99300 RepID=A0ABR0URV5_REHGL